MKVLSSSLGVSEANGRGKASNIPRPEPHDRARLATIFKLFPFENDKTVRKNDGFFSCQMSKVHAPTPMIFLTPNEQIQCRRRRRRAPITRSVTRISLTCRQKSCAAGCQSEWERDRFVPFEGEREREQSYLVSIYYFKLIFRMPFRWP